MSTEKGLETLLAWQKAMKYAVSICKEVIPVLPRDEKYSLADQLRRDAQSVPANIAEGHGRYYYQDGVRFCYIARGSLEEVFNHLCFAHHMGYVSEGMYKRYAADTQELIRIINGYITFLKRSKQGEGEPGHNIHETIMLYYGEQPTSQSVIRAEEIGSCNEDNLTDICDDIPDSSSPIDRLTAH